MHETRIQKKIEINYRYFLASKNRRTVFAQRAYPSVKLTLINR